jgi:hypothetical protein
MNPLNPRIDIEYNKNDFFYLTNAKDMSTGGCKHIHDAAQVNCGANFKPNDPNNVKLCYQNELCINKESVEKMYEAKKKHLQYQVQLRDLQTKYQNQMMTTFNLGIGIIGTIVYIYYNK